MWLFLAFLAVPIVEIALFIQVGGLIGLWPTLLVVVLTALAGTWLVRSQGMAVLGDLQRAMERGGDPATPLAHGAMILFSGALLLTPGFFTDAVGFALLIPGVRLWLFSELRRRMPVTVIHGARAPGSTSRPMASDVIDGTAQEVDPDDLPPRPGPRPSGWTKP